MLINAECAFEDEERTKVINPAEMRF